MSITSFFSFSNFNTDANADADADHPKGVLLMYIAVQDFNDVYMHKKLDLLSNLCIVFLFILIVFNIFLVALYA